MMKEIRMIASRRARYTVLVSLLGLAVALFLGYLIATSPERRIQAAADELMLSSQPVPLYDLLNFYEASGSPAQLSRFDNESTLADIHSRLSADEWLSFLGKFQNNISPISEIRNTLPVEVTNVIDDCGAEYAQVVETTEWSVSAPVINIFCFYVVPAGHPFFDQHSMDELDYESGNYITTRFQPAEGEMSLVSPYILIRIGMPDPAFGPYPMLGTSQDMAAAVKEPDAAFQTAAELFSIASGRTVDASQVRYIFAAHDRQFGSMYFEAEVAGAWYYAADDFSDHKPGQGPTGNYTTCKRLVVTSQVIKDEVQTDVCNHPYSMAIE